MERGDAWEPFIFGFVLFIVFIFNACKDRALRLKYITEAWLFVGGAWTFYAYYGADNYWPGWAWLIFLIIPPLALHILSYARAHKGLEVLPFALFLGWCTFSMWIMVEFKPALEKPGIGLEQELLLKNLSATAYIELLVLSLVFLNFWNFLRRPLALVFFVFGFLHALSLIYDQLIEGIVTGEAYIGLLGNRSLGASFTAIWIFWCFHFIKMLKEWGKDWVIPKETREAIEGAISLAAGIGVLAVLVSHSTISYLAMLIGGAIYLFIRWPKFFVVPAILLGVGVSLGGYIKPNFFDYGLRTGPWLMFMSFWRQHFLLLLGSGLGTFKFWGPAAQMANHFHEGRWWLWLHSDWLQILFELGAVGLALAIWCFGVVLKRAWKSLPLFLSLLVLGVTMGGNYPLRMAPFALFIWFLACEAISV
jgi:hypothetical protein